MCPRSLGKKQSFVEELLTLSSTACTLSHSSPVCAENMGEISLLKYMLPVEHNFQVAVPKGRYLIPYILILFEKKSAGMGGVERRGRRRGRQREGGGEERKRERDE